MIKQTVRGKGNKKPKKISKEKQKLKDKCRNKLAIMAN